MEVQLAVKGTKSAGSRTPPHRNGGGGEAKNVPNYLKPSTGSCHHVCKYGGTHTFEEKEAQNKAQPKTRKEQPGSDTPKKPLIRVRLVPRKLFGRAQKEETAAIVDKARKQSESVEWKDIMAYDAAVPAHGSSAQPDAAKIMAAGDAKKTDAVKGKKSHDKAKISEGEVGDVQRPPRKNTKNGDTKSVKPPKGKKPAALLVVDQEMVHGYQILSPSVLQTRADLLRDLEKEMVQEQEATNLEAGGRAAAYALDQDEYAAAAESSRPVPAHRRAKSMSVSSLSVRFPFTRQASKNSSSAAFKVRSRSSKAPPPEERPARARSRRGAAAGDQDVGRGIHLRIRSLRRRGVGGSGTGGGFVVPAVALRHQKTLEKKRSQRLYNSVIEETASKLVKSRKSRVKALVGAFESVISKIAK